MRFSSLLAVLCLFASCKTQNLLQNKERDRLPADTCFVYNTAYEYLVRQDDKVSISVWGQDELSVGSSYGIYNSNEVYGKWLMVDARGNIEVPKIGSFHIENMSIATAKDSLKKCFGKWIVNPIVDVKILNREITILGEVRNPSAIPVDKEENKLLELIAKAGGFEFYANLKKVKVLRQEGENVRVATIDLTQQNEYITKNIQLLPGDVVVVPSKKFKDFDKRVSTIIPFTTTITAAAILLGAF